jgi:RNA polymerase sigma-70 factor, ECF subfamily
MNPPSRTAGGVLGEVERVGLDRESRQWIETLTGAGPEHDAAVERLHALLLRACHFEIARRRRLTPSDRDDLALQAAADALMAVLRKLGTYRGESRFTTWAYKFALLEAAVKVRRKTWQEREVPLEADGWERFPDAQSSPESDAETSEVIAAVQRAIKEVLTPHQRTVVVALTLNDVPIDVLADRLGSTRGALYKTLHDARKKLRRQLADEGHVVSSD